MAFSMLRVPLRVFFCLILLAIGCQADVASNENKADFDEFLKKYNLTFDATEYNKRFGIFNANVKRIQGLKASGNTAVGINRFAATDPEEFKAMLMTSETMARPAGQNASSGHEEPAVMRTKRQIPITSSLDYRTKGWVTPVRNQAQCGSCWAFAATAGYESVLARYWGDKNDLSEQYVVDCASPPNYGCNGGWVDKALDYLKGAGHTLESYYPYTATHQTCKNWVFRPYMNSVTYFYSAAEANVDYHVYHFGPVTFAFRVPADFQYYTGGVYDPPACATTNYADIGWHGMVIIGYTPDYWIVKNSWGTGWGDQGYVYYKRGKQLCGMSQFTCVTKA